MKLLGPLAGLLLWSAGAPALARSLPPSPAKVSYLQGTAEVLREAKGHSDDKGPKAKAPWRALKKGTKLARGDAIRTAPGARLELRMLDGSRVRLGGGSKITLKDSHFSGQKRKVTLSLWLGRLWAKVTKKAGGERSFAVETHNAVAGVRGTSFSVVADADLSAIVRVYTGTVGVKKNKAKRNGNRVQVAGPQRIDRKQWEEIIATSMKQVKITQIGEIKPAEDFEDSGGDLEWAMWNKDRDRSLDP